jgi:hypothetical protein
VSNRHLELPMSSAAGAGQHQCPTRDSETDTAHDNAR